MQLLSYIPLHQKAVGHNARIILPGRWFCAHYFCYYAPEKDAVAMLMRNTSFMAHLKLSEMQTRLGPSP